MKVELSPLEKAVVRAMVFKVPVKKGKEMKRFTPFKDLFTKGGSRHFLILREPTRLGYMHVQAPDGTKGYLHIWSSRILEVCLARWKSEHGGKSLAGQILHFEVTVRDRPHYHLRILK